MGIASLVIGIISMFSGPGGILLGLIAVILGLIGRRRLLEEGRSSGVATGGIVTGSLGLIFGMLALIACFTVCSNCTSCNSMTQEEVNDAQDSASQQADLLMQQLAQDSAQQAQPAQPTADVTTNPAAAQPAHALAGDVPAGTPSIQSITIGSPIAGIFPNNLPIDPDGRPFMDYSVTIAAPGQYTITLISPNGAAYDPYLRLMQNGITLAEDDDSAAYPNAMIQHSLTPGSYIIRVTSFGTSQVANPSPFTLTIVNG